MSDDETQLVRTPLEYMFLLSIFVVSTANDIERNNILKF